MGSDSSENGDVSEMESEFIPSADEHEKNEEILPLETANSGDPFHDSSNQSTYANVESANKTRKRKRDESNWARNVSKKLRNMGMEYKTKKNVTVKAKTRQPINKCCKKLCYQKICEEKQNNIFSNYYKLGNFDLQTSYLCELISVIHKKRSYSQTENDSRRSNTRYFQLPDLLGRSKVVCKEFFKNVLQISDGRISRIL